MELCKTEMMAPEDEDEVRRSEKKLKRSSQGDKVSTNDLILLVKAKPAIWDRRDTDYRDKFAKDRAWADIFTKIEPNYERLGENTKKRIRTQIQKKWYNVRDSYAKYLRNNKRKPYIYGKLLKFLDPLYENLADDKDMTIDRLIDDSNEGDSINLETLDPIYLDIDEPDAQTDQKTDTSIHSPKASEDYSIVSVLANLIQKEEDEDRAFFKSITPLVKSLNEESKIEFRIEVLKLIQTLKKKDCR